MTRRGMPLVGLTAPEPGVTPDILAYYVRIDDPAWMRQAVGAAKAAGAVALLTVEPWGCPLADVAAGKADAMLADLLRATAPLGERAWVRFGHEMNGNWYPWAGAAGDFVRAWWRFATLARTHAAFARLVWSPNVPFPGSRPMAEFWPGAEAVDRIALDGYAWDGTSPVPFADLFGPAVAECRGYGKPLTIGETACAAGPGKATWIRGMWAALRGEFSDVGTVVWFNFDKSGQGPSERDWRIGSDQRARRAFLAGLRRRRSPDVISSCS